MDEHNNQLQPLQQQQVMTPAPAENIKSQKSFLPLLLFIAATFEGVLSLSFLLFVLPQISATTEAIDSSYNNSPAYLYLAMTLFLCGVQIITGLLLRNKVRKNQFISKNVKIMTIVLLVVCFFLSSRFIGLTIVTVLKPIYNLTSSY